MNTVTLTHRQFFAIIEHRLPPKPPTVGVRWRRFYGGKWFVAEYVQAAEDVIGIEFWEVKIAGAEASE